MKNWLIILFVFVIVFASCKKKSNDQEPPPPEPPVPEADSYIRGADLSFFPEINDYGTIYYDTNGLEKYMPQIFKDHGCNLVRLKLWHTPDTIYNSLPSVEAFADKLKEMGFNILLDIHYSDTWADPGKQFKPTAWNGLSMDPLKDSVYQYTLKVVTAIQPEMVQIGNEINRGFLWDDGRINKPEQFTSLLKEGLRAVDDVDTAIQTMVHFAGYTGSEWFYSLLDQYNVMFDVIGLSYYPMWHGKSLDELEAAMHLLDETYSKPILLVEVAYPFTYDWNDWTHNIIGDSSQILPEYPASITNQELYLLRVKEIAEQFREGSGFVYWAPDWVAYKGATSEQGSSWENQAMFDFNNKALPSFKAFSKIH